MASIVCWIKFIVKNKISILKKSDWVTTWNGHENQITWELLSPMSFAAFFIIVNYFYTENKTISICKYGMINRDNSCDIQIRYNNSKSKLFYLKQFATIKLFIKKKCNFQS